MQSSVRHLADTFHSWFPLRDRVAEGWLLTGSPLSIALITATYVCFVTVAGPRWMSDRKAFDLRRCVLLYNVFTTFFSAYFMCRFLKLGYWDLGHTFLQDMDRSDSPASLEIKRLSWWLYLFKLSELSDTVFFVLRKNNRQISTLHVAHHVIVSWNMWLNVTYGAQAQAMFITCFNSFVHVFMYSYYFLAALGPAFTTYLWWKKYLTMVQIAQFVILFGHAIGMALAEGNYVVSFVWIELAEALFFLLWFMAFYSNAYKKNV
ncbi:elongation of very long chain fatty acids protein 7 [Rhipicephalus sanguineus]|uniref:Elongation of very long chain fatty acids protein n=1 Tax=Rhipicephalus sanguineus TaxID=34632 RepID=A0A9D4YRJ8_RHISA|nr:elongation of very long chain fatty acids protein 7 [Rhipicephalus sanguineus]KAH7986254.1 hypothetical protein HPB52_025099 [Rhipicephalus sanguineus]